MKIPKIFIPERNLDLKLEELETLKEKKTSIDLHELIYEYIGFTDFSQDNNHIHCVKLDFKEGTELILDYENRSTGYKILKRLENAELGLSDVEIKTLVEDPLEIISHTFSENPLGYKSLPFDRIEFVLEDNVALQKSKNNKFRLVNNRLVLGRMCFDYKEEGDYYLINNGEFCDVVRSKSEPLRSRIKKNKGLKDKLLGYLTTHSLGIYEILPFTEEEREILSKLKEFNVSYRFARPDDDKPDYGHLFNFEIKKEENMYGIKMDVRAGFLEGLDLKSVWLARNMLKYVSQKRSLEVNNETWYKRHLGPNGWHCRIPF